MQTWIALEDSLFRNAKKKNGLILKFETEPHARHSNCIVSYIYQGEEARVFYTPVKIFLKICPDSRKIQKIRIPCPQIRSHTLESLIEGRLVSNFWTFGAVLYSSFCQFLLNKSLNFHDFLSLLFEKAFYSNVYSISSFTVYIIRI